MHIPDGYLSPSTSAFMFLLVLPFWLSGVRKLRKDLNARGAPLIALLAAFSFVIMMFNIPIPGGTTAHVTGAALAAVILGPGGGDHCNYNCADHSGDLLWRWRHPGSRGQLL